MSGKYLFASVILLLLLAAPAFGQESGPVVHRLTWQQVEYVSRYEVAVEVYTRTNTWIEIIRKTSESETFIECPLFAGSYRFRVWGFDLLGNPGAAADWVYFEVRAAREEAPVPPEVEPPEPQAPPAPSTQQTELAEETRRMVGELRESVEQLHEEVAGLRRTDSETPAVEEVDKSIFRLEAAVQPLAILPFSAFNEIYATSPMQPLGFALRFSAMPFVTRIGVFGLELNPSWNFLANDILETSRYTHLFTAHLSLVWQIQPFGRRTAVNFAVGGGASFIQSRFDFDMGNDVVNVLAWNPSAAAGVSFTVFLTKTVFVKAAADYLHIFTRDNMTLNYLRPSLGIGWRF